MMIPGLDSALAASPLRYGDELYPRQHIAFRATRPSGSNRPAVQIDGDLSKSFWEEVPWTEDFVDIATETSPKFRTRAKIRWDENFLYIGTPSSASNKSMTVKGVERLGYSKISPELSDRGGAYLEETDVWGTLTKHNSVIFHDNDFEVFVSTDATNHNYKEFEVNCLNCTWSLLLNKPYAESGSEDSKRIDPENGYDMEPGLISAVKVYPDEINNPSVKNSHWTVEVAMPMQKLMERNPDAKQPDDGVLWRINFSRVQWSFGVDEDNKYVKKACCQSCRIPGAEAEDNWVWSKQGEVAMHLPERWGILQFSNEMPSTEVKLKYYEEWPVRCAAMGLFYAMKEYQSSESLYTDDLKALAAYSIKPFTICNEAATSIMLTDDGYEARVSLGQFTATINHERYLVVERDIDTALS